MRFAVPALVALAISGSQDAALRVLRVTPTDQAGPTAVVTVTFDRPVAGALDRSVDPATIFRIAPPVPGRLEWRDPITIRFRPDALLESGVTYTVTVANDFAAMDGSRLAAPYRFSFVVRGARVLTAAPTFRQRNPQYVVPRASFELRGRSRSSSIAAALAPASSGCGPWTSARSATATRGNTRKRAGGIAIGRRIRCAGS